MELGKYKTMASRLDEANKHLKYQRDTWLAMNMKSLEYVIGFLNEEPNVQGTSHYSQVETIKTVVHELERVAEQADKMKAIAKDAIFWANVGLAHEPEDDEVDDDDES